MVQQIRDLIDGYEDKPTDILISIFSECDPDPSHFIRNLVNESCDLLKSEFETIDSKMEMSRRLFWKLLESILLEEKAMGFRDNFLD